MILLVIGIFLKYFIQELTKKTSAFAEVFFSVTQNTLSLILDSLIKSSDVEF